MIIENAHEASYIGGWQDYRAVASYDQETWFRIETSFDGRELTFQHKPDRETVYYAYFAAYPTERYRKFVAKSSQHPNVTHEVLGETLDGQSIDYLKLGDGPRQMWVIARQHPGETMGSWWIEGFVDGLTDPSGENARALLEQATIHIVPCMNLDGSKRGHLRTNAGGVDLNRAWRNTTIEASPEVYLVREKMRSIGVDFFLDVHGDEAIPNNFLDGAEGIPGWDNRHEELFRSYQEGLLEVSNDFQTKDGYPTPPPGKANLDIAANYVAETWDCLSMTLEMPFKDANVNPDPVYGWSPQRCRAFALDHILVMASIAAKLR